MTQPCEPCAHGMDKMDIDVRFDHAVAAAADYDRCDTCPFDWQWMKFYGLSDSKATLSAARVLWLQLEALWQEVRPKSRRKVRPMPEDIEPGWWDVPQPERKGGAGLSLFERVKATVRVEDIAERLTELHGVGNLLKGKCPLHGEQNGEAFAIYLETQTWRCFGQCQDGGDVVRLVQKCLEKGIKWQK